MIKQFLLLMFTHGEIPAKVLSDMFNFGELLDYPALPHSVRKVFTFPF